MGFSDSELEAALESVEGSGLISARAGFIVEKGLVSREVANLSTLPRWAILVSGLMMVRRVSLAWDGP